MATGTHEPESDGEPVNHPGRKRISRRQVLQRLTFAALGAASGQSVFAAGAAPPAGSAASPTVGAATPPAPPTPQSTAATEYQQTTVPVDAAGSHGGDLAAVTNAINGPGLYVGNEFKQWTDAERQASFAAAARWGFTFICPKVGGYTRTWYSDDKQLTAWKNAAAAEGIKLAPFIYTIPSTALGDAAIAAVIANTCGVVVVDMEDEWGSDENNKQGYQGTLMTAFGSRFRQDARQLPIVVTGYGDPITRFGFSSWPFFEMQTWADAYSPQYYYGVWSQFYNNGVDAAIDWGARECSTVFHPSFPIVPSVSIYSAWSKSGLLSPFDLKSGRKRFQGAPGPIFWWEYGGMTDAMASAILS